MLTFFAKAFSQESLSLIGKWKTLEVSAENFIVNRNDSIILPEELKNYSKVSLQNRRAHIRTYYSKNIFVFEDNDFYLYKNENPRTIIFDGKFKITSENKIIFNVKNIARQDVETTAIYHFENGELHLKMYAENNSVINYVLTKVED